MSAERSLLELDIDVKTASRALREAIAERFPPGSAVHVRWGGHETPATVLEVGPWGAVRVESVHGKAYTVGASRLVEYGER